MNGTAQQNCVARSAGSARRGSRQQRERVLTRRGTLLCPASQLRRTPFGRSSQNLPSETVWKFSGTGQTPHHQTNHGRVYESFRARAQPLVVLAHPLLFWLSQEKVLSTTHLRGKATYPRGGMRASPSRSSFPPWPILVPKASPPPPVRAWEACARPLRSIPSHPRPTACPCLRIPRRATGEKGARAHCAPTEVGASVSPGRGPSRCAPWP